MIIKSIYLRLAFVLSVLLQCVVHAQWQVIPETQVLVNQVGYDKDGLKYFLLQSKKKLPSVNAVFKILNTAEEVMFTGRTASAVRYEWAPGMSAWYWRGDFTELIKPGIYRVQIEGDGTNYLSYPFEIGDKIIVRRTAGLVTKFFYAQRCGSDNYLHKACHTNDAIMPDGAFRDMTGGWHDAGNYTKMPASSTLGTYGLARFAVSQANLNFVQADEKIPSAVEEAI